MAKFWHASLTLFQISFILSNFLSFETIFYFSIYEYITLSWLPSIISEENAGSRLVVISHNQTLLSLNHMTMDLTNCTLKSLVYAQDLYTQIWPKVSITNSKLLSLAKIIAAPVGDKFQTQKLPANFLIFSIKITSLTP